MKSSAARMQLISASFFVIAFHCARALLHAATARYTRGGNRPAATLRYTCMHAGRWASMAG